MDHYDPVFGVFLQTRAAVDRVFRGIADGAGWTGSRDTMHDITDFVCYEDAIALFLQRCFNFSKVRVRYSTCYHDVAQLLLTLVLLFQVGNSSHRDAYTSIFI